MSQPIQQVSSKPPATPGWIRWHHWNQQVMAPVTTWLCDAVAVGPPQRVLDLGCGTGIPSLTLAARVPNGQVIATDISAEMLEAARENALRAGLQNVQFREMDADSLDLAGTTVDAVTTAFMLMFRPEPAKTVAGAGRALKPGGRLAIAVWDTLERNPFFGTVLEPVSRFIALPPTDPKGPGTFRLAGDELEKAIRAGGFDDVRTETVAFKIGFESVAHHWEVMADMAPPVKAARQALSPADLERLKSSIAERLQPHLVGETVQLLATAVCAVAKK
jgi:SAM-dependent methyltransferase